MRDFPHSNVPGPSFSARYDLLLVTVANYSPSTKATDLGSREKGFVRGFLTTAGGVTLAKLPVVRTFEQVATGASPPEG